MFDFYFIFHAASFLFYLRQTFSSTKGGHLYRYVRVNVNVWFLVHRILCGPRIPPP